MMYWYGNGMNGWGYAVMTIGMVLFWTVAILGGVALIRHLTRPAGAAGGPSAEQLLAERFARGEIDEEEYGKRLKTLRSSG
ncbi:SHOCT domain-containing protein [Umezawaea endophytica]|uniref:SHOCT domain-containing protein n=1 Tax=Umezawaea endophytica TaxID=1654476 RepID=A0A9X2VXM2_9PSEU|nr:SHOCT domain-containing protein [Umezawaea endophytica]MCS7484731.1 SHOCT domain-containing protein [Umezawaea endophytica]